MTRDAIRSTILTILRSYLDTLETPVEVSLDEDTRLVEWKGILDSMGLVTVVLDIEGEFRDRGMNIVLTDERAMSRQYSPFRTVGTLTDFIEGQVHGGEA